MAGKKSHPIIGITTYGRNDQGRFHLPGEYVDAVRRAGGVPVLLPPGETDVGRILDIVDGLIFAGGGDIDPSLYNGRSHPSVSRVDRERDEFELALARAAFQRPLPVLGICRGFQLLNVACGGDLEPHLPDSYGDKITHRAPDGEAVRHQVTLEESSRLAAEILGQTEFPVVSKHHQGIRALAPGWTQVGRAPDGVPEAIENSHHPWMVAVLWHPEMALEDETQMKLFRALVARARQMKK